MDGLNVSSELLTDDVVSQQLPFDSLSVGLRLVALIHRHDHRHCDTTQSAETQRRSFSPQRGLTGGVLTCGSLGVLNGLDRLVHDAVVSCHHQDDDVSGVGSTGSHGGEGGVTWRVQEGDLLTGGQLDWKKKPRLYSAVSNSR